MSETNVLRSILKSCSRGAARLFRNNVAMAWVGTGKPVRVSRECSVRMYPGDILLRQARPLHAGLCEGSADLIGWRSVVVTQDMVGKQVALFAAIECKDIGGRTSAAQKNFLAAVNLAGGLSGVARSEAEAHTILGTTTD